MTASVYSGNPQPGASAPSDVTLCRFIVVTFNFTEGTFGSANITISYSDADVSGIDSPYVLYKYVSSSDSYVALDSVVDSEAQTVTATVNSTSDPLFAIGGLAKAEPAPSIPVWTWVVIVSVIVIVVIAVALVLKFHNPFYHVER